MHFLLLFSIHFLWNYRKVPKVTTLVTFGFSNIFLSLLLEGRYFRVSKTCTLQGPFEVNKIATNVETYTVFYLEKLIKCCYFE